MEATVNHGYNMVYFIQVKENYPFRKEKKEAGLCYILLPTHSLEGGNTIAESLSSCSKEARLLHGSYLEFAKICKITWPFFPAFFGVPM